VTGAPRVRCSSPRILRQTMRMFSERFGSKPIDTAPIDQDVALIVTDGGKPYSLNGPFKLTAAGWVNSGKGTPLAVTPLQWKPYVARSKKR
jgi:hypothetical protein